MTTLAGFQRAQSEARQFATDPANGLQVPLFLWAVVLMAALLAYFVHLANGQVVRGEQLREAQRKQVAVAAPRQSSSNRQRKQVVASLP